MVSKNCCETGCLSLYKSLLTLMSSTALSLLMKFREFDLWLRSYSNHFPWDDALRWGVATVVYHHVWYGLCDVPYFSSICFLFVPYLSLSGGHHLPIFFQFSYIFCVSNDFALLNSTRLLVVTKDNIVIQLQHVQLLPTIVLRINSVMLIT